MGKIKVHAGDFLKGKGEYSFRSFLLKTSPHSFVGTSIPVTQIRSLELATEENIKRVGGTGTTDLVRSALPEPMSLQVGSLTGPGQKEITFVAEFKDGRKLLATTDSKTFTLLQSAGA